MDRDDQRSGWVAAVLLAVLGGTVLRGKVGDVFTVTLVNDGTIDHSLDFHASEVAWDDEMRSIGPGESVVYQFEAKYAGAFMYHCGTPPTLQPASRLDRDAQLAVVAEDRPLLTEPRRGEHPSQTPYEDPIRSRFRQLGDPVDTTSPELTTQPPARSDEDQGPTWKGPQPLAPRRLATDDTGIAAPAEALKSWPRHRPRRTRQP